MKTCIHCHAEIRDDQIQTGKCPSCGHPLARDEAANPPPALSQTLDSSNIDADPEIDQIGQTLDSSTFDSAAIADSVASDPSGRTGQTIDSGDFPPVSPAPSSGEADSPMSSSESSADSTLPPSAASGQLPAAARNEISETVDSTIFPPISTSDQPSGWSGGDAAQTVESGELAFGISSEAMAADDGGKTVEVRPDEAPPAPDDKGTWRGTPIAQTVDSAVSPQMPGDEDPGTWKGRAIAQTFEVSGITPEDAQRMTGVWGATVDPEVGPHMTLKGAEAMAPSEPGQRTQPPGPTDSFLVIKSRSILDSGSKTAPRSTSKAGDRIDPGASGGADYELLEILGQGGMGVVYAARQASIDRLVALKMLKADMAGNVEQRQKFLAEAAVTGDLDHPNIVPIYDLGSNEEGALFYSMKRVRGTPWSTVIAQMSLPENLETLMKVADALGFAHSRNVVHRDLKPENVMLGDFGEVLLMDWGLAQSSTYARKAGSITQTSMGGTPAYMAPEMATGPIEKIGSWSDIYLLGAVLYEVITGRPPHTGKTVMGCLFAAAKNEIQPTEYTGELIDIAYQAMSTDPARRFASVREFQSAVRQYQSHSESLLLSSRAEQEMADAEHSGDYQAYSRALFGFQEALVLWDGNTKARSQLAVARVAYAHSALNKGDYDLAASLLDGRDPAHAGLLNEIRAAQLEREARQRRLRALRRTLVGGVALFLVTLTGASLWIWSERNQAIAARQEEEQQRIRAETQTQLATSATKKAKSAEKVAKNQRRVAVIARDEAERQEKEAIRQKGVADEQAELARKAKEKEEYEAYIARIGAAAAKIDENSFDGALATLQDCKSELRHWEWGRLMHLCRQNRTLGAGAPVNAIAFSPNARWCVTGSRDHLARIWDLEQGEVRREIRYGGLYVHAVAISQDGRYVAVGGNDPSNYVEIWNAETGELVRGFEGHSDSVTSVAFSRDGSKLLTASYDKTARLWDTNTGQLLRSFQGHNWWVWSAVFSPNEEKVVTASQDGTAMVWSVKQAGETSPPLFNGHEGPVYAAAFSPDGEHVATGGYDGRILMWSIHDVKSHDFGALAAGKRPEPPPYVELKGHSAPVRSVAFSKDGAQVLSGSQDNTLRIWSAQSGDMLKTLRGHAGWVYACAFSPDGEWVLSGSNDHKAKLWHVPAYEEVRVLQGRVLRGHADAVLAAGFSADGKRVVTASRDHTARTWQVDGAVPLKTFEEGHEFLASAGVFFPGGKQLLTSAIDNSVRVWDTATGAEVVTLTHTGRSAAVALSSDGNWILTGGDDQSARLWDAKTGELLRRLEGHSSEVTAVAISPDQTLFYSGDSGGHGRIWDAATGNMLHELNGHSYKINAAHFLPASGRLLTASNDNTVAQWDPATGRERSDLVLRHPDAVGSLAVASGGQVAMTSCQDGKVRLWDVERAVVTGFLDVAPSSLVNSVAFSSDGQTALTASTSEGTVRLWNMKDLREIPGPGGGAAFDLTRVGGALWSAALSPDGTSLLTVGGNGARLWDVPTVTEQMSFSPHAAVAAASFSLDGAHIVTGSWDNSAKVWNAETGQAEMKLTGVHTGHVNAAVFSPDGGQVLTASDDKQLVLWDRATGEMVRALSGHTDRVRCAAFSTDGNWIVSGSNDKTARIWNAKTGEPVRELKGHVGAVLDARFSVDGDFVITASEDNTARVWNANTGAELLVLSGHTAPVTSAAFSPDGRRLLTASRDSTAKVWDASKGQEVLTLKGHEQEVTAVSFSPDGHSVLSASRDGTAIVWLAADWRADSDAEARQAKRTD